MDAEELADLRLKQRQAEALNPETHEKSPPAGAGGLV
jgi:hypothetical protein